MIVRQTSNFDVLLGFSLLFDVQKVKQKNSALIKKQ